MDWDLFNSTTNSDGNQNPDAFDGVRTIILLYPQNSKGGASAERISNFNVSDRDSLLFTQVQQKVIAVSGTENDKTVAKLYLDQVLDSELIAVLVDFDMAAPGNALTSAMLDNHDSDVNPTLVTRTTDASNVITDTHDGGSVNGKNEMSGTRNQKDVFIVDVMASNRAGADTITGFEDGRDSVKIAGNSITAIYAKVSDGNTVLYSIRNSANSNADSDILAVINGFAATDANFTTDDFDGNLVTTVEVL